MTPVEFMARLGSLVAPPRYPLLRLHGVFAPRHRWRSRIVPKPRSHRRARSRRIEPTERHSHGPQVTDETVASSKLDASSAPFAGAQRVRAQAGVDPHRRADAPWAVAGAPARAPLARSTSPAACSAPMFATVSLSLTPPSPSSRARAARLLRESNRVRSASNPRRRRGASRSVQRRRIARSLNRRAC
jgi:hypothetical protein